MLFCGSSAPVYQPTILQAQVSTNSPRPVRSFDGLCLLSSPDRHGFSPVYFQWQSDSQREYRLSNDESVTWLQETPYHLRREFTNLPSLLPATLYPAPLELEFLGLDTRREPDARLRTLCHAPGELGVPRS